MLRDHGLFSGLKGRETTGFQCWFLNLWSLLQMPLHVKRFLAVNGLVIGMLNISAQR